jgi:hypothetical protein
MRWSQFLWPQFYNGIEQLFITNPPIHGGPMTLADLLTSGLNRAVGTNCIYESNRFAGVVLSEETRNLLAQDPATVNVSLLNRLLLEDAYPAELVKCQPGRLWQDFPTVPGRTYEICFACGHDRVLGSSDGVNLHVKWDTHEVGFINLPAPVTGWRWRSLTAVATATTSRLMFENPLSHLGIDGVSVIWLNEPPTIVTEPAPVNTIAGGSAAMSVGVTGLPPLAYQWFCNGAPLAGKTSGLLQLDPVAPADAGEYCVVITNAFGAVTSAPVALTVEAPTSPTLVLQPWGETVAVGGYFALSVAALGTPPLNYQWYLNGVEVNNATNRQLVLAPVDFSQAGNYAVKVWNQSAAVWSLPALLKVEGSLSEGGGAIQFANRYVQGMTTNEAPVFDVGGLTKLSGSDYVAQLYAGPTLAQLRAVGTPSPFITPGLFQSQTVLVPTVPPNSNAVVQVRAWQRSKGASYEEARALGGKFGRSVVFQAWTGTPPLSPLDGLPGLASFSLQSGLPAFNVGRIELAGQTSEGVIEWTLRGETGCQYVIERALSDLVWRPLLVLTNATGTVNFTDPGAGVDATVFYRARILD